MLSAASTSSDPSARKKGGAEPDITVAIMDKLKDVTIYEPNLHRVDVEDKKGLELVLVLTATVIADIYFTAPSTSFNIGAQSAITVGANTVPQRPLSAIIPGGIGGGGKSASPTKTSPTSTLLKTPSPPNHAQHIVNPGVLNETARLQRQQVEDDRRRAAEEQKRAREVAREEERIRRMLREEDKVRRKREAEVEKETEKLRKQYSTDYQAWQNLQKQQPQSQQEHYGYYNGRQNGHQSRPSGPPSAYRQNQPPPQPQRPISQQLPPRQPLYSVPESQQARPPAQGGQYGQYLGPPQAQQPQPKRKSSFLGLFGSGSGGGGLSKKKSSLF
ncbi:hypothetical protein ABW19_dt0205262 [Dactylella cylindrospora]|nr:hypothetical protein ABW19_dt0205262 [Dactylella cylindrospora]